jgi:hypothetical protein
MTAGLLAAACVVVLVGLVRRPRLTICLLALTCAAHAAGLVRTPAPVAEAQARLDDWQRTTAERVACGHLARAAATERQVHEAAAACRRAWAGRER